MPRFGESTVYIPLFDDLTKRRFVHATFRRRLDNTTYHSTINPILGVMGGVVEGVLPYVYFAVRIRVKSILVKFSLNCGGTTPPRFQNRLTPLINPTIQNFNDTAIGLFNDSTNPTIHSVQIYRTIRPTPIRQCVDSTISPTRHPTI